MFGQPNEAETWTYTWEAGRQLKSMTKQGMTVTFDYDRNGLRTRKTVTDTNTNTTQVTNYTLNGSQITHMTRGNDWMHFYYGANDRPVLVNFNGTVYTYVYSLQGDVVALLNSAGQIVVEYKYDAWGKVLGTTAATGCETLAEMEPFRYRAYVYDLEVDLYYLQNRYFNQDCLRFISMDTIFGRIGQLLGHNLFIYCENNPIFLVDPSGSLAYPGEIHRQVCLNIVSVDDERYSTSRTMMVSLEDGGKLFADIISMNGDNVYIYEVKRWTHSAPGALRQLAKYLMASFVYDEYQGKSVMRGSELIEGSFTYTSITGESYDVYYKMIGFGIILYDYSQISLESATQRVDKSVRKYEIATNKQPELVNAWGRHAGSAGSLVSGLMLGLLGGSALRREFNYT